MASGLRKLYQVPQNGGHQHQDPDLRLGSPLGSGAVGSALGGSAGF